MGQEEGVLTIDGRSAFQFQPKICLWTWYIGYVVFKMVPITGCFNEETKSILLCASYFYFETSVVVSDKGYEVCFQLVFLFHA